MKTSIRARLFAGFGVVLALMAFVSAMSIHRLSVVKSRLEHIIDVSAKKIDLADWINHDVVLEINRAKNNILLSSSRKDMQPYATAVDNLTNEYYIRMEELYRLAGDRGRAQLDASKAWFEKFLATCRQVVDLAQSGRIKEARELSVEKGRPLLEKAHATMTAYVEKLNQDLATDKEESERDYQTTRSLLMSVLALALLAGVLTAVFIVRGIVGRVHRMSEKARQIASGKIREENGEEEPDQDELSPVALSLKEISRSYAEITRQAQRITQGDLSASVQPRSKDDELAIALQEMTGSLREAKEKNERQDWLKTGQNELNERMRGDQNIGDLARNIMSFLARYLGAQIGAVYVADENTDDLKLCGSYAFDEGKDLNTVIRIGEGLVGQAAIEKETISVGRVPDDYARINSAIGDSPPRHVLLSPFLLEGRVKGVAELGSFTEFSDIHREFLNLIREPMAIAVNSAQVRTKIKALLEQTQLQAEELQAQQEELRQINEELEQQTAELKASEDKLKEQQGELEATNEELEEKTDFLERQKAEISRKNLELENARRDIEQKARKLEVRSRYKSEFLANMSHELRTPLNSLLILAENLAENKGGNLSDDQVESARIIRAGGAELLELINEILDLSKVEAGKMTLNVTGVSLREIADELEDTFRPMADEKSLTLDINLEEGVPPEIATDRKRLMQVIKNLVSNAIKFTEQGGATVTIHRPGSAVDLSRSGLDPENAIAVSVIDTGIGIPENKHLEVFEAFQQLDGSTSRKYGGTGLGLSISRELARILHGEIQLHSEPGKGSTFVLYVPLEMGAASGEAAVAAPEEVRPEPRIPDFQPRDLAAESIPDDRDGLEEGDRTILVIEDDREFAKILMNQCHSHGFKCIASATGEMGLELAEEYLPQAVILDIHLPGMNGWQVLDDLKRNIKTRHIPVHMLSVDDATIDAFRKGAMGFVTKPVTQKDLDQAFKNIEGVLQKRIKDLLVVEDNEAQQRAITLLIGNGDVMVTSVGTGREAIDALRTKRFDCMVLDLGLPDMNGFQLLAELDKDKDISVPPIIVYTGKDLTKAEEASLREHAESIIVKGVKSEERLLDETALFLHRVVGNLSQKKQKIITDLYNKDDMFAGKKVLLVDDDMRNVFALSKILGEKGMEVLKAEDGQKALELLERESGIDLILMDIMMPIMDGYEAMKRIRQDARNKSIPIIAQTAKAMKEDREKVMAAGANDYIDKPLNIERLLSMMRVWLYQ